MSSGGSSILDDLVSLLDGAAKLTKDVGDPINAISSGFCKAEEDIDGVENFIGDLNDIVKFSVTIGDLCFGLTEIPVVGEILDGMGTFLREFGEGVKEVLTPINEFKAGILDEVKKVLHEVNGVLSKITKYLNFFINK